MISVEIEILEEIEISIEMVEIALKTSARIDRTGIHQMIFKIGFLLFKRKPLTEIHSVDTIKTSEPMKNVIWKTKNTLANLRTGPETHTLTIGKERRNITIPLVVEATSTEHLKHLNHFKLYSF